MKTLFHLLRVTFYGKLGDSKLGSYPILYLVPTRFLASWRVLSFWLSTEMAKLLGGGGGEGGHGLIGNTSFGKGYAVKTAMSDKG
jgi:hypothetical protein